MFHHSRRGKLRNRTGSSRDARLRRGSSAEHAKNNHKETARAVPNIPAQGAVESKILTGVAVTVGSNENADGKKCVRWKALWLTLHARSYVHHYFIDEFMPFVQHIGRVFILQFRLFTYKR